MSQSVPETTLSLDELREAGREAPGLDCGALCIRAADEIELLREALIPFAKVAKTYPNAHPDIDMRSIHDARCPVQMLDFFRADAVLP